MNYFKIILCILLFINYTVAEGQQNKQLKTEVFKVSGTCIQCKNRIEKTVRAFGAKNANWVIKTNLLTITYDSTKISKTEFQKNLALVGHDSEEYQTDDATYKSLPPCCYYDRLFKKIDSIQPDTTKKSNIIPMINHTITGIVLEEDGKGKLSPIFYATVYGINNQFVTSTDSFGVFQVYSSLPATLVVSYIGYKPDTINVNSTDEIKIVLKNYSTKMLNEVEITSRVKSSFISSISTLNTLNIGSKELTKAACCNLSESFETSPAVDVNYADAVTGIKQIQLLGLSGNYTQLTTENIPEIRGLAGPFGLTFIPGPWIEGMQLTKGVGSVANGYESIAGQINIEEKKPDKMDKLFINSYANENGRLETSVNAAQKINEKWSTALLTHINGVVQKNDRNDDGFLDLPIGRQYNILNRWRYADTKGVFAQFAVKALNDHRQAGQTGFNPDVDKGTSNFYGVGIDVQQYQASGKIGYVFPEQKYKSIGLMVSAINYQNKSYYGFTNYSGKQNSMYANLIYQSIIGNSNHKYRTGLSFVNDDFKEKFNTLKFNRKEIIPGAFVEYTYTSLNRFTAVAGIRADYHNQYGLITTPRLHLKYDLNTKSNLRFTAGSGFRTANIFAENAAVFVSSRQMNILNPKTTYGYGLNPEKAWNYGLNFVRNFKLKEHEGSISLDAYRTDFVNQVVVDLDASPQKVLFYNLSGKSFSTSLQAEINYEIFNRFDVRVAYRWLDVQTQYSDAQREKPLVAKNRAFVNLAYETKNKWKFDYTLQWVGKKRLQNTSTNIEEFRLPKYSPNVTLMAAQITKKFNDRFEVYVGGENLTNFIQSKCVLASQQPFSPYFDASIVWGPVNGRIIYTGFRYRIK